MALTVLVRPEAEEWLQEEAAREGVSKEAVAARLLENQWATARRSPGEDASDSELLLQINAGLPLDFVERYRNLRDLLEAEALTENERQEFIRMNQRAEQLNVERMTALSFLAQRRGVTLPEIMKTLGVGPVTIP
jgi:hypothetical protein